MKENKHWATELQTGDRAVATIRHETDGSKNISNAVVIVVANDEVAREVMAAYENEKYVIPYNELDKYDPHEYSKVICDLCNYSWVSVRPLGTKKLECPNCNNLVNFENVAL